MTNKERQEKKEYLRSLYEIMGIKANGYEDHFSSICRIVKRCDTMYTVFEVLFKNPDMWRRMYMWNSPSNEVLTMSISAQPGTGFDKVFNSLLKGLPSSKYDKEPYHTNGNQRCLFSPRYYKDRENYPYRRGNGHEYRLFYVIWLDYDKKK